MSDFGSQVDDMKHYFFIFLPDRNITILCEKSRKTIFSYQKHRKKNKLVSKYKIVYEEIQMKIYENDIKLDYRKGSNFEKTSRGSVALLNLIAAT